MSKEELDQQSKLEKVHDVFEKVSPGYDKMNAVISFQLHKGWRKQTMSDMMIKPGSKTLDVCCGTADWTLSMAEAVGPTGDVTGFDFSANMLAEGQKKGRCLCLR
ncbi:ubiquinone/menaquinone biosynthesis methyltransferase [Brochothrix campestris FSL F6-1037]|uniref:Ubiquinone/menaquinone biosynthesis methyltransferase n=1 Tax=Brochothrix campestris FSL F6-1037 TaxID=1265861 RepID=W7D0U6_9LIST|nr:ubiquinone/menaquinone biosynthesis methyltransferase [Brochothrix campestris FSL F6-1037]